LVDQGADKQTWVGDRDHPDLLQHAEGVEGRTVLRHLAVLESEYLDAARGHPLAGGSDPHQLASVGRSR
jgi:hypothetical protein